MSTRATLVAQSVLALALLALAWLGGGGGEVLAVTCALIVGACWSWAVQSWLRGEIERAHERREQEVGDVG